MIKEDVKIDCPRCNTVLATLDGGRPRPLAGVTVLLTGGDCFVLACPACPQWCSYAVLGARPADEAAARSRAVYLTAATEAADSAAVARLAGRGD